VSQGVVQTFTPTRHVPLLQATKDADGKAVTDQVLALGPAASQIAIKQLGTNGGGFFNANSAHPFENPTGRFQLPRDAGAAAHPGGAHLHVRQDGEGHAPGLGGPRGDVGDLPAAPRLCVAAEQAGNPAFHGAHVDQAASALSVRRQHGGQGGALRHRELRPLRDITTAVSCGAVNAMHDSFTPLGGLVPLWLMQLGEVIFGGVGAGPLRHAHVRHRRGLRRRADGGAHAGVPRQEDRGLRDEDGVARRPRPAAHVLIFTAIAVATEAGKKGKGANPGPHGFSEILYAFSSAANNNGSAFGGLNANTPFYNTPSASRCSSGASS
jgi:K+-transporting ATPase ATPase A chain